MRQEKKRKILQNNAEQHASGRVNAAAAVASPLQKFIRLDRIRQAGRRGYKMENYTQLEELAKAAKDANSFRGYESGSATAELNDYITKAEETAADAIKRLESENAPQERIDKVNFLLERYKTKIKSWLIDYYNCEASCPSIMICGGSNFPTR